jgi:hypothetical protein
MSQPPLATSADTPADYERLKISPDHIAQWEDGARTDNSRGTYEWWYFDAHLDDGSKLVIVFMNKDLATPGKPLPETGFMVFGEDRAKEFAWLPSVPQGTVEAKYRIDGETYTTTGVGYHDHNWGNAGLLDVIHNWYWARGEAGPYTVIASYITAHERYGFETVPIFMLAKDGKIIADDATKVRFEAEDVFTDEHTGKPVAGTTRYSYEDRDERYVVTFVREKDLARSRMIDDLKGVKRLAAKAVRFDGAYLRFTGDCTVQRFQGDILIEEFAQPAIWELMYFGHAR